MKNKANVLEMSFKIEWAQKEDLLEILTFIKELAAYEKLEDAVVATEESLRKTLFEQKNAEVLFIKEADVRIGFALFFHNYSTFLAKPGLYLEDFFIREAHRGKGYGKRVLSYLAKLAIERGCGRFEWAVLDWNEPSIQFYLKLGAKPLSDWTTYRCDENTMKQLANG